MRGGRAHFCPLAPFFSSVLSPSTISPGLSAGRRRIPSGADGPKERKKGGGMKSTSSFAPSFSTENKNRLYSKTCGLEQAPINYFRRLSESKLVPPTRIATTLTVLGPDGFAAGKKGEGAVQISSSSIRGIASSLS